LNHSSLNGGSEDLGHAGARFAGDLMIVSSVILIALAAHLVEIHFDPDGISEEDLDALRKFTGFLQRLQSVLPGNN
jgi:hypothetical protein